ncbi:MAG: hypothetical protein A3E88_07260 [Legionellales bacterium RIFCSPHIGHO2_12_FULL_35_11]|nr:MAG: hypothetical protein A3E88_07260 [Legionellales bacterium RIFCSPHIGHO2_12_FULL_35_11]
MAKNKNEDTTGSKKTEQNKNTVVPTNQTDTWFKRHLPKRMYDGLETANKVRSQGMAALTDGEPSKKNQQKSDEMDKTMEQAVSLIISINKYYRKHKYLEKAAFLVANKTMWCGGKAVEACNEAYKAVKDRFASEKNKGENVSSAIENRKKDSGTSDIELTSVSNKKANNIPENISMSGNTSKSGDNPEPGANSKLSCS